MDSIADLMLQMPPFSPATNSSLLKVPTEAPSSSSPPFPPPSADVKEQPPDTSIISPVLLVEDTYKGFELGDDGVEFSVLLKRPPGSQNCGLGLTIVGYVSEKDKDKGKSKLSALQKKTIQSIQQMVLCSCDWNLRERRSSKRFSQLHRENQAARPDSKGKFKNNISHQSVNKGTINEVS